MTSRNPIDCFINASPLAVFSVLSDIEKRALILKRVAKTRLIGDPPVGAGSCFREWRNRSVRLNGRRLCITRYDPPEHIAFSFGLPVAATSLDIVLAPDRDGVSLRMEAGVNTPLLPKFLRTKIESAVLRQWSNDIADIKRHAEARANPAWRGTLSDGR